MNNKTIESEVSSLLVSIGILPNLLGYHFICESVKQTIDDPGLMRAITTKLYPQIARSQNTTASRVERAIRHAIEVCWSRGRIEMINKTFNVKAFTPSEKPTNAEFIAFVADRMLLANTQAS